MAGRLTGTKMGDRAVRTGTKEKEELEERKKKKVRDEDKKKKKKDEKLSSISMYDLVGVNYKPTTRETRETYEALLTAIQDQLGDQPRDVLIGAADEVLSELKNEKSKDLQKRSDVESMLGKLEDQKYFFLCNLSKKITDYQSQSGSYLYERAHRTSEWFGATSKRGCAFPMVIWPEFRMGLYRVNDHPNHTPQFIGKIPDSQKILKLLHHNNIIKYGILRITKWSR